MDIVVAVGHLVLFVIVYIMVLRALMRRDSLQDRLHFSQLMINELAPKAQAWDDLQTTNKRDPVTAWPKLDLISMPRVESDLEKNYRVAYQHLSAECDGCDEPEPTPRRRRADRTNG